MKNTLGTIIINSLKGLFIGIANVIPGVSGGTIAVISGVYEPLVGFFATVISRNWKAILKKTAPLFFPVMVGVLLGILLFANVIDRLFIIAPSQIQFLFIGLILGSIPFIIKQSGKTRFRISYLIVFLIAATLLVFIAIRANQLGDRSAFIHTQEVIRVLTPVTVLIISITGMVTTATMLLPGVSGAFIMVLIGMYATYKTMVVELNFPVIAVFLVGAFAGLFLFSKVIALLLRHFHGHTYFIILGLTVGSIAFLWTGLNMDMTGITSIITFFVGFFLTFFLSGNPNTNTRKTKTDISQQQE